MSALKLILSCLIFTLTLFLSTTPTQAAFTDANAATWRPEQQSAYTTDNLVFGFLCQMVRIQGCPVKIVDEAGKVKIALYDGPPGGGALAEISGLTVALYNPPISSVEYLANLGESIGLSPKPAYAQVTGSGEGIIKPVFKLWEAARNLALLAFIIVFLVVGIMIMFRQKISPQAVIGVQQALPSLIIGLILVTFSYFITALLVDVSFVGIRVISELFIKAGPNVFNENNIRAIAQDSNILNLFSSAAGITLENIDDVGQSLTNTTRDIWGGLPILIPIVIGTLVGLLAGPWGAAFGFLGGLTTGLVAPDAVPNLISLLISLILVVALFIQMFRLFFGLLGAYISILVSTIAGPFYILFGSIPGRGGSISSWIKSIVANALIFPAVFAMFLFAGAILGNTSPADWKVSPPLFGGLTAELLRFLIAYGILLSPPAIPDMVRNALGVKGPQGIGQAALGGFMGGFGVAQAGYNRWTDPYRQVQKAWEENRTKARAGLPAAPVTPRRPYRGFPWF